ncbi:hypothetical protein D3C81_591190 [compost metagenome]
MANPQPVAPLTIIAIFAGIIEASALATLPFLSERSQDLYTWFLVGFPFFLTALFFLTLNFNYKSFYKPDARSSETHAESVQATPAEPITIMLSGQDAAALLEQHVLQALKHPPGTQRQWLFCNMEKRQRTLLWIRDLADEGEQQPS